MSEADQALCHTDTQGAHVDRDISSMTGAVAMPRSNGELVFDAPWQSRAFGMAISLSQAGYFKWDAFRGHLGNVIAEKGQNGLDEYYHCWLDALERSMAGAGAYDQSALHVREDEYRSGERDEVF